ncbi:ABC transporter permease [Chitinophaga sp. XS-30]|uniref:MlaE family ABC transporter permease n=1 Tax=Chitinophaga sp. XS-30 TaxID=2604421 RepID=UPI0011DCAC45|nr:ABC transporter permease [Chitinophaga sp. XS-30]QEH39493.1 ABC transporter permease [Chitinophaga sp. XS-30]
MEFKLFYHFGRFILMIRGMFSRPENMRMYWKEFMHQCNDIGVGSLGIVFIISLFLGAVTTVQTAYQLVAGFIPKSTIAQIVRDTLILELAPTMVCIVLGGVVGSKIASELGNMRISEQIDAQEIMGINTKAYLIGPKILASMLTIPCLVVIAAFLGIWGGLQAGMLSGIISSEEYMEGLRGSFDGYNVFVMLSKSYTYSFIISSIPAYYGYNVSGGALEIGRASTKSVVVSCILILFTDYLLAAMLL